MKQYEVQPWTLGTPDGPEIIVRAPTARLAAEEVMQETMDKALGCAKAVVSFQTMKATPNTCPLSRPLSSGGGVS